MESHSTTAILSSIPTVNNNDIHNMTTTVYVLGISLYNHDLDGYVSCLNTGV